MIQNFGPATEMRKECSCGLMEGPATEMRKECSCSLMEGKAFPQTQ